MGISLLKQTWSYADAKGIAEAVHGSGAAYSELNIVRLAPGDRQLQVLELRGNLQGE